MVVEESELDTLADRLSAAGIDHPGPQPGGGARVLIVTDPDGNQVVVTGA
jgi:hypothetical protein